jgi:outer membrane receptor protein involved in Fe transport
MKSASHAGVRPRFGALSLAINDTLRRTAVARRALAASALGLTAALVAPVGAQEAAGEGPALEEIVVTGSRIVRRDYESNSPIVTMNAEDFETQTGLNIENYLNQMPQYNPAASPVTTDGDVQITPVNSVGIASISLRGFGPNRSLVLVDGKRMVPINPLMVTDINGIPSALIERSETITGGASAVYGADAVGGVTNFILKDDFEGFEIDLQSGMSQEGDGEESRLSAVLGTNFSDGRGNVTIGLESYRREAALDRNHDRWREWWSRTDTTGTFAGFLNGVNGYACNGNVTAALSDCPFPGTVNALFSNSIPGTFAFTPNGPQTTGRGFLFSPDGTIFVNSRGGLYRADGSMRFTGVVDNQEYGMLDSYDANVLPGQLPVEYQNLKWFHQRNYISAPQDRYSFFASGNFDVTDTVRAFARATFAESDTKTILFGTNAITGWETQVPYNPTTDSPVNPALNYRDPAIVMAVRDNPAAFANPSFIPTGAPGAQHPVPAQLAILLNSRTPPTYCLEGTFSGPLPCGSWGSNSTATQVPGLVGTTAPPARWQPQWNPDDSLPPRNTDNVNEVWQVDLGLDFDIGQEWTGEFYLSHGESSTYNVAGGNLSLERYRQLTNAPDYGRGARISGNEPPNAQRPFFGAGDVTCTSGFYDTFFRGDQPLSNDCYEAVNATLQTRTQNEQNIIELNFQGPVAELPAGELRLATGYQSRRNAAQFYPDILQSQISFTDQVIGVYPTGYLDAETSVNDYYVEGLIPVLQGKRGVERLELEVGARYSDYEHTEEENTWKTLINWQVTDWLRFRGGFNRATRAPNLGELFLNPQEIFTGAGTFGDACGLRSNSPFGAGGTGLDPVVGPGEAPGGATTLAAGQTPEGAQSTRLICEALMGGAGSPAVQRYYFTNDAPAATGGGFAWVLQRGNPNLKSEVADTWTWGLVASLENNLTLSFDMYKVDIEDAIMLYSVTYSGYRCFGTRIVTSAAEAAAQAATPACQLVPRDLNNGAALNAELSYDNQATIETAGMDATLNWFKDIGAAGTLGVNFQATILDTYKTKTSPAPFDVETDWKGSLGPSAVLTGTNPGAFDYRLITGINYARNNWSINLRWRHLPSVVSATVAAQNAIIENNAIVSAGGPGLLLSYTPHTEIETADYNLFDMSFGWDLTDMLSLRGGITNLFDTDPEAQGAQRGYAVDGTPTTQVCPSLGNPPGCLNPFSYGASPPGPARTAGAWTSGFYDAFGRRYFVGLSLRF